ncbi:hypothetical protein GCM10027321_36360 [Massilia terrae]|uniref:Uncharacterized protein n=1 Tax=Massilia terrae TaxID=1811224 RepID=A0ABT2D3I7_9BURK|nr:hypothetical protein [Massilia terrae]MCS0660781.1 hypothetical protein [Massilia terrae]
MLNSFKPWTGYALRIGVAPGALALVRTSIWRHEHALLLEDVHVKGDGREGLTDALYALLDRHPVRGWPLTLVLADELVRLWQVTPPRGSTRLSDLKAASALRFQTLFGDSAADWRIQADWSATRPFLAAALPQAWLDGFFGVARARRCHLTEVVPQLVAALNQYRRLRRPDAWFGLSHGGVLNLAVFDGKAFTAVRATPFPSGADCDWLNAYIAREALRIGVERPGRLEICGPTPRAWAVNPERLEFACTVFEDAVDPLWSDAARLALTGRLL